MNTKLLMTFSSGIMAITGIALSFLPNEILTATSPSLQPGISPVILQILGAVYFGFAMVNWTAKANLIGGIYGRPIAIGNLSHFVIGALALIKFYAAENIKFVLPLMVVYLAFAIGFAIVFFTHPVKSPTM